jgi:DNA-binding transcriptional regulator YiaG
MPRPGPSLPVSPLLLDEFSPSALTDYEQSLALLCQELGDLPQANAGTPIADVQNLFRAGQVPDAIRILAGFLEDNQLEPEARKFTIDPKAFKYQRGRKRFTQEVLATALGVKNPQISHVEQGRNSLSLPRLLLVLTIFEVRADEILVRDAKQSSRQQEKIRPLRGMSEQTPHTQVS